MPDQRSVAERHSAVAKTGTVRGRRRRCCAEAPPIGRYASDQTNPQAARVVFAERTHPRCTRLSVAYSRRWRWHRFTNCYRVALRRHVDGRIVTASSNAPRCDGRLVTGEAQRCGETGRIQRGHRTRTASRRGGTPAFTAQAERAGHARRIQGWVMARRRCNRAPATQAQSLRHASRGKPWRGRRARAAPHREITGRARR
mmetsp:Transcript_43821/g.121220  ORF Transcript_43821/g.121220 Transcript_43821/m.121220 type:complete len:200 (+) Transcript_43821:590-1189(+)